MAAAAIGFDAAAATPAGAPTPAAATPDSVEGRRSWTVETAAGVYRGIVRRGSSLSHDLAPHIGDLPFVAFTLMLSVLFLFSFFTSSLLIIASSRAEKHDLPIGALVQFANFIWIGVQLGLLLDLAITYNKYYRPCRLCVRCYRCMCAQKPAESGSQPPVTREVTEASNATPRMGESSFRQPTAWRLLARCLGVELSPRKYMLILATVLPLNVLFFYTKIGSPVFTDSIITGSEYDIDALLDERNWPQGGGLIVDIEKDVVTSVDGSLFPVEISNKACYSPGSPEFRILARLHKEDTPKQAYCESLLGTAMVGFTEKHGSGDAWQQDEDVWEEGFDFIVRIFGALAGLVADRQLQGTGGFLEDMTDVFDMYMLTFADVQQLHEGRPLLSGSHRLFWHSMSYQSWISVFLAVAYITMVVRALSLVGYTPMSNLVARCGSPAPKSEIRVFTIALGSLLFIEVPFLTMRWIGWYTYGIPVSVLAVKNIFHIYAELQLIGVFRGFEEAAEDKKRTPVCCFWRICYGSSSERGATEAQI